jgi:hypothetical protein
MAPTAPTLTRSIEFFLDGFPLLKLPLLLISDGFDE